MPKPRLCGPVECHAVALTRNPTSRSGIAMPFGHSSASTAVVASMRWDMRLLDHLAPDLRFLRNEGLRSGGLAAGGVQVDLGELVLHFRAVEHLVDRLVELGNNGRRGL